MQMRAIASCELCIWLSNNQWNLKEVGMNTMNQLQITDACVQCINPISQNNHSESYNLEEYIVGTHMITAEVS